MRSSATSNFQTKNCRLKFIGLARIDHATLISCMRLLGALAVYIVTVFAGGALIAPWLHALVGWGAEQIPALEGLAYQPFHRYVNRCFMVIAILGLWPLAKVARMSLADTGWSGSDDRWRMLRTGLLVGFISLAIPAAICVVLPGRSFSWPENGALIVKHFVNAIAAAVLVSVLEESVFRGVVFGALKRNVPLVAAVGISSFIYALVHFFERTRHDGDVLWSSGLALLPKMLRGFGAWEQIVPGFFALSIAGIILALAVKTTGSLYFSIGLHAGWIFWLKTYKFFTRPMDESHAWFWGTGKLIDGWVAFAVLLATWWWLARKHFFVREKEEDEMETGNQGGG
jgi:uncharacterized protein